MTILITGGAGFIGSHLADELVKRRAKVIVFDNLSNGQKDNINTNAIFIKGDIRNYKSLEKIKEKIDIIFHLAALTDVRESIEKPNLYFQNNVVGSFNILEFCRRHDIEKIVFTSSAAVYAESLSPLKEDETPKPSSPYGIQKLIVENLIKNYNETYGISFTIFRLFNVYGPRARKGVIKNLIDCLKNNKPFHLYGNGNQVRDFIYIRDAIKILLMHHKFKNEIVNVGTGKPTSINQLINYVQDMTKIKLKIIYHPSIKGEIKKSVADISKLKKKIKFKPIDIKSGIEFYLKEEKIL